MKEKICAFEKDKKNSFNKKFVCQKRLFHVKHFQMTGMIQKSECFKGLLNKPFAWD